MNQKHITDQLCRDGRGHRLSGCPVGLIDVCAGQRETALVLWRLVYQTERRNTPLVVCSAGDWMETDRLTVYQVRKANEWLHASGLVQVNTKHKTPEGIATAYVVQPEALAAALAAHVGGVAKLQNPTPAPAPEPAGGGGAKTKHPPGADSQNPPGGGVAISPKGVDENSHTLPLSSIEGVLEPPSVERGGAGAGGVSESGTPAPPPAERVEQPGGGCFVFALPPAFLQPAAPGTPLHLEAAGDDPAELPPGAPANLFTCSPALRVPYTSDVFWNLWLVRRAVVFEFHHPTRYGPGNERAEMLALSDVSRIAGKDEAHAARLVRAANARRWKNIHADSSTTPHPKNGTQSNSGSRRPANGSERLHNADKPAGERW